MPSIWKYFSSPKAEEFFLPTAEELQDDRMVDVLPEPEEEPIPELPEEPVVEEKEPENPVSYAQLQAESILRDARREAAEIMEKTRAEAEAQAEQIREQARQEGFEQGMAEGVARGMDQAMEECTRMQEAKAAELEEQVEHFLSRASDRIDGLLDSYLDELRDLAISVAEKVVCVSLRSSEGVIGRMIQNAIEKRKRREWAQIYIAECDVKRITPIPASLASALSALSDRVRIVPMADDEAGTCIIEMPDEIIDASASTQIKNIRTMLNKTPLPGVRNTEI